MAYIDNIPQEMRDRRQWMVCRGTDDEWGKVPFSPLVGEIQKGWGKDNPAGWVTFDEAREFLRENGADYPFGMLGYCPTLDDPFTIIDLDKIDDTTKIPQAIENQRGLLDWAEQSGCYIEHSKSGRGRHIIVRGKANGNINRGASVGLEAYGHAGSFVVITGKNASGHIVDMPQWMAPWFNSLAKERQELVKGNFTETERAYLCSGRNIVEQDQFDVLYRDIFKWDKRYEDFYYFRDAETNRRSENDADFLQAIYSILKNQTSSNRMLMAARMYMYSPRAMEYLGTKQDWQEYLLVQTLPKLAAKVDAHEVQQRKDQEFARQLSAANDPALKAQQVAAPAPTVGLAPVGASSMTAFGPMGPRLKKVFEFRKSWEVEHDPAIEWAVKNVLPRKGIAAIYGWSAVGKSFLTLDMLMHVADGKPWFGHKTRKMPVSYLALEGGDGMRNRLKAYRLGHAGHLPEIDIYKGKFDLSNRDQCEDLVDSRLGVPGGVVVIDTFSKALGASEENSNSEMKAVLENAEYISTALDSLVIIVHHSTKPDAKTGVAGGARGAGAIIANTDATIQVVFREAGADKDGEWDEARYWTTGGANAKVKEAARSSDHNFVLETQDLNDPDEDGEPRTSCYINPLMVDNPAVGALPAHLVANAAKPTWSNEERKGNVGYGKTRPQAPKRKNGSEEENDVDRIPWATALRDAIIHAIAKAGGNPTQVPGVPPDRKAVPRSALVDSIFALNPSFDPANTAVKKRINAAVYEALRKGSIGAVTHEKIQSIYLVAGI